MLKQGVNLNALDAHSQTPLIYAAAHNPRIGVVQWLIQQGADLNHQDFDDWTALMHAARSNPNPDVLLALLEAGADPMLKNNYGDQALSIVSTNQNFSAEQKAGVTEALEARMTE